MKNTGFTLVELSIVLVIIGLITGGVLVGQDMIRGAKFKAQLRQIQQHDAALLTFYEKFNQIPGDCSNTCGSGGFGLVDFAVVESGSEVASNSEIDGFMGDSSAPISEASATVAMMAGAGLISSGNGANEFQATILKENAQFTLGGTSTYDHYWTIGIAEGSNRTTNVGNSLTPYEAWRIDSTIDDASPSTGTVLLALTNGILRSGHYPQVFNYRVYGGGAPDRSCVVGTDLDARRYGTEYDFGLDTGTHADCPIIVKAAFAGRI